MKRIIKFALLVGAITAAAKMVGRKKAEWQGLTEEEVRSKIKDRAPDRVPTEKLDAMTEKVVSRMRSRGYLKEA
jgi:hypothetical protein